MTQSPAADAAAVIARAQASASGGSKEGAGTVKKTGGMYNIRPDAVCVKPDFNPRFDYGDIDGLAEQIKAELKRDPEAGGLINPIQVRRVTKADAETFAAGFAFVLVEGHRRLAAIRQLMKKGVEFPNGVPAKLLDRELSELDALVRTYSASTGAKAYLPLEEAAVFKRLRDGDPENGVKGLTVKQITALTGRSDHHIIATLALLEADDEVVDALKGGKISGTVAKSIAKDARGDKAKQKELVALAKTAKGSAKQAGVVKTALHDAKKTKAAKKGKVLKIRALTDAQLSKLGSDVAADLVAKTKDAGKEPGFDIDAWVKQDDKLALAFTYGALQALKAAAGMDVPLSV